MIDGSIFNFRVYRRWRRIQKRRNREVEEKRKRGFPLDLTGGRHSTCWC
jgi:hypothetical protein